MNLRIFSSIKVFTLIILCLQNSIFTVLRRYSQGVLKETYSKYEVLMFGEVIKIIFSVYVIYKQRVGENDSSSNFCKHLTYLTKSSRKMFILSLIYGLMNILSFVALRNISAGVFTICAQLKILTTATFSTLMLGKSYTWVQWRALLTLVLGAILFSESIWNNSSNVNFSGDTVGIGIAAVTTEVTLSGFASIYFEKVIKSDPEQLNIWERNYQLALGSFPVYISFILYEGNELFSGWSMITFWLSLLGAAGGLLVALSIKYADSILKTLATTGAIVLSSLLDSFLLGGPLTAIMMLSGCIVVIAIFDYSFDPTNSQTKEMKLHEITADTDQSSSDETSLIKDHHNREAMTSRRIIPATP